MSGGSSAQLRSEKKQHRVWKLLSWAAVLVIAFLLRDYFQAHLDLRDFPGPASGHIMTRVGQGLTDYPGVDGHLASAAAWVGGDPLAAMRVVMMILGLTGVVGAMLGGWAVGGHVGALAAGLLAAGWSQSLMLSLMISYDTAAMAAGWLGFGLALASARWGGMKPLHAGPVGSEGGGKAISPSGWAAHLPREALWLAGLCAGCMLVVYGLGAKEVAHPLLPMLVATPFFIEYSWLRRGAATLIVALSGIWGLSWQLALGLVDPRSPRHIRQLPEPDPMGVIDGLGYYWDLIHVGPGWHCNILLPITLLAVVGALIPGAVWLGRLALLGAAGVALGLSWELVADWLRIRYMAVPNLPLLLLSGAALSGLAAMLRRLGPLRLIPLVGAFVIVAMDAVDYGRAWSALREPWTEIEPATLPEMPRWPIFHNGIEVRNAFGDFTVTGGISMIRLTHEAPAGGVGTIPLRDSRDSHITAAAALAGKPFTVLEIRRCCPDDRATPQCAADVVKAFDEAGGRLFLARTVQGDPRLNMPHLEGWRGLLKDAVRARGTLEPASEYWWTYTGTGSGGALPCLEPVHNNPAPEGEMRPMGPPLGGEGASP